MRLFIALDFNELKENLTKLQSNIDESIAKVKKTGIFHLTLKFLGKVSEDKAEEVKNKLKEVKFAPFSLTLDKIGVFPTEKFIRVVWIGTKPIEKVTKLQKDIETALKGFNFKKDIEFHPHITLARIKYVDDKEKFIKNIKGLKVEEKTIEIKDFRLVKSKLTPEGPVYGDLETYS